MNDRSSGNRIVESPRSLTHPGTGRLASLVFGGPARLARGTLAAVLTSLRSLRRPGWSERPGPFNPTRSAKEAGDTRWPAKLLIRAGLEGAGRLGDGGPLKHRSEQSQRAAQCGSTEPRRPGASPSSLLCNSSLNHYTRRRRACSGCRISRRCRFVRFR